jgi:hypothetical protein
MPHVCTVQQPVLPVRDESCDACDACVYSSCSYRTPAPPPGKYICATAVKIYYDWMICTLE